MIGREEELEQLAAVMEESHLAVVTGAPGCGKTVLVRAFAERDGKVRVLEDLHLVPRERRPGLLRRLMALDGRAICTSRERVWLPSGARELPLAGMSVGDARALWEQLDVEEGRRDGFEAAFEAGQGHPDHLRWAHSGRAGAGPLLEFLAGFRGSARTIVGLLANVGGAMPVEQIIEIVDDDEALRALQELWLKLVIRVDLGGTCALAPACRAFAGEALSPLQLEQLAMLLARTRREEAEPPSPSHARPISVMAQRVAEILEVAADDRSFGSAAALSYDARHHELRGKGARVSLKTRPVLRRLFFALAAQANRLVDREELTLAVWNRPYHPQAHDAVLRVNVSTLRRLVAPFGLTIEFDETGYRLYAPDGLGLVEEAGRDAAPIPCILRKA